MAIEEESVNLVVKRVSRCWRVEFFLEFEPERQGSSYVFRAHFEDLLITANNQVISRDRTPAISINYSDIERRKPGLPAQIASLLDELNQERLNPPLNQEQTREQ